MYSILDFLVFIAGMIVAVIIYYAGFKLGQENKLRKFKILLKELLKRG